LTFDSLYIGGGKPSILPAHKIGQIIDRIYGRFNLDVLAEITLEVNPGTVTLESLKAYRERGVTRLNIGVQSFQESHLKWLGRIPLIWVLVRPPIPILTRFDIAITGISPLIWRI
jgi:oxygen-independent coproporphyrinogen-3 oxidase